jgi:hypothetical protein
VGNSIIKDITNLFFDVDINIDVENFLVFRASTQIKGCSLRVPSSEQLLSYYRKLENSHLLISVLIDGNNILFSSNSLNFESKLIDLKDEIIRLEADDSVKFSIEITEKTQSHKVDIFNAEKFFTYLSTLSLQNFFEKLEVFNIEQSIEFRFWEKTDSFNSDSLYFYSVYPDIEPISRCPAISKEQREKNIENRAKASHFVNAQDNSFIPEDFEIINGKPHAGIEEVLNGVFGALNIIYISDFSSLKEDALDFRIKGYKLVSEKMIFSNLKSSTWGELYEIYKWVYSDGNFSDKIGLARNVISIHLSNDSLFALDQGASDSVKSGYDLYLKENVKQYIEIKNKINEFLYGQSDKALDLTKSVFSTIKAGIWTFTTFFVSVFLLRAISGKSLEGAVSFEVFVVSILLVFISSVYFSVSIYEINVDRNRLLERYDEVRARYKDLLNESDLNKIINVRVISKKELDYINGKRNSYCYLWALICFVTLISVYGLYKSSDEVSSSLPTNTEEIILKLDSAYIEFGSDKDNSFLTPPKS